MNRSHPVADAGRLAMLLTGATVLVRASVDPDLWGHLRFGLDLLDSHVLPSIDPYSFTQDVPWINHEWLSELLFAGAYRVASNGGLLILKGLILGTAFAILASLAGNVPVRIRGWLVAATFLALFPMATTLRPQLWTILGMALVLAMLAGRLRLAWMPVLFAVWVNLHGGWIVGAGTVALWIVGRLLDTRSIKRVAPQLGALSCSLVATLLNPYGWRLWAFLAATVRLSRSDITEWQPVWAVFEPLQIVLWPLSLAILVGVVVRRRSHLKWASLLPALCVTGAGLLVNRLGPIAGLLVLACAADTWETPDTPAAPPARRPGGYRVVEAVAMAFVALPSLLTQARCLPLDGTWVADRTAAAAFASTEIEGRLIAPFDWGEYVIWHFGRRLRVSIDGRRETVYSQGVIERNQATLRGEPEGLDYLGRLRPEFVWGHNTPRSPLEQWLRLNDYRIDITTPRSFIAVRSDVAPLAATRTMPSCFP